MVVMYVVSRREKAVVSARQSCADKENLETSRALEKITGKVIKARKGEREREEKWPIFQEEEYLCGSKAQSQVPHEPPTAYSGMWLAV